MERLVPELQLCAEQYEALKREASSLCAGLTDGQLAWSPTPGRWSIGDCFAHLNATSLSYLPMVDAAIARARAKRWLSSGPYRQPWPGRKLIALMEPPPRRRFRAPRIFAPPRDMTGREAVEAFLVFQDRWLDRVRQANGLDIGRARVRSPATRLLRMSLGQSFRFTAAHERRHLWQARQVRSDKGFPDM